MFVVVLKCSGKKDSIYGPRWTACVSARVCTQIREDSGRTTSFVTQRSRVVVVMLS